jgi:hypothetical protein
MLTLMAAFVALPALSCAVGAQGLEKAKVPTLNLTLTAEKTSWRAGEAARVKIKIENASGGETEIPSTVYFTADNRSVVGGSSVTMLDGVFWSPVSLLKSYDAPSARCRNDLSPDRVETLKGTNVVTIFPAKETLPLKKGEAKEFDFDLAGTCWGHSIAAFYPDDSLFSLAAKYKQKTYGLYFETEFDTGKTEVGGKSNPVVKDLKSNVVVITID